MSYLPKFTSTYILIGILAVMSLLLGFNWIYRPIWNSQLAEPPKPELPRQATAPAANLKNGMVGTLSAQQKVAQLFAVPVVVQSSVASSSTQVGRGDVAVLSQTTIDFLQTYQPGFVELVGAAASQSSRLQPLSTVTTQQTTQQIASATAKLAWQPMVMVRHGADGQVLRGSGFKTLPSSAQLCVDPQKHAALLAESAAQVGKSGISMVIGPVADLVLNNQSNTQLCGELNAVTESNSLYVESFGAEGILPIVAHFPGLGGATQDPRQKMQTLAISVNELKPFQFLLKRYLNIGVLVSPVKVSEKFSGQLCSQSPECLANFAKDFPQVTILADGVSSPVALQQVRALRQGGVASNSSSVQATAAATTQSATASAAPKQTVINQKNPEDIAASARLSLLAGAHVLLFDSQTRLEDIGEAMRLLAEMSNQEPALQQAIEQAWQKTLQIRIGKNT